MSIGVMLFNPFTGKPRHPSDIESDPKGILVWDGEEPLRAYTPQRTWVGLTDEEKGLELLFDTHGRVLDYEDYADAIEAKLKEKNT
jgi:hypothetical protein